MIKLKLCQLFYEKIQFLNVAEFPLQEGVASEQINLMKTRSNTVSNVYTSESVTDQRNTWNHVVSD